MLTSEMSYKNSCSWKWRKIHKKCLCWSLLFNQVARWRPATLFKKRLYQRSFFENYAKFLITAFWRNTSWWMLLKVIEVIEIIFNVKLVFRSWEISLPNKFSTFFPDFSLFIFMLILLLLAWQKCLRISFQECFAGEYDGKKCVKLNLSWSSGKSSRRVKIMFLKN